jgi:hypothetical protein
MVNVLLGILKNEMINKKKKRVRPKMAPANLGQQVPK